MKQVIKFATLKTLNPLSKIKTHFYILYSAALLEAEVKKSGIIISQLHVCLSIVILISTQHFEQTVNP